MLEITARGDCVLIWGVLTFGKGWFTWGFTGGSQRGRFTVGSRKGGFTGGSQKGGHKKGGSRKPWEPPWLRPGPAVQYIHKPFHNAALGLETLVNLLG